MFILLGFVVGEKTCRYASPAFCSVHVCVHACVRMCVCVCVCVRSQVLGVEIQSEGSYPEVLVHFNLPLTTITSTRIYLSPYLVSIFAALLCSAHMVLVFLTIFSLYFC